MLGHTSNLQHSLCSSESVHTQTAVVSSWPCELVRKNMIFFFFSYFLFLFSTLGWSQGLHLSVHAYIGKDLPDCITANGDSCKTLTYVIQQLNSLGIDNNVSIAILATNKLPVAVHQFENISNLELVGLGRRRYSRDCVNRTLQSGFIFSNVTNLRIKKLYVHECGIMMHNHSVVMRILNSQNVIIEESTFSHSRETALLLNNTFGNVSIINTCFYKNRLFRTENQHGSYSGGMEIVFSESGMTSKYNITACQFQNNTAPRDFQSYSTTLRRDSEWRGQSTGGGLGVLFQGNSSGNSIILNNCTFFGNRAKWGGGMHVLFQGSATGNRLEVNGSRYISNNGEKGGGGVCIRYFKSDSAQNEWGLYNELLFHSVNFTSNVGDFGAGTAILGTYSRLPSTSRIAFQSCLWNYNMADYGPAMNIGPALFERLEDGHLPSPEFDNCSFIENALKSRNANDHSLDSFIQLSGIFIITKYQVHFGGETKFIRNSDSALYMNSGKIIFQHGSEVLFAGNSASRGAAIAAYGYSSIILNRDSHINFTKNYAEELGAGIYYQTFDQHDFRNGRECFLKLNETDSGDNVSISFEDNKADIAGTSVFASTLFPCFFSNSHDLSNEKFLTTDVLDFVGNIQYDSPLNNNETVIATSGRRFSNFESLTPLSLVTPGKTVEIPLQLSDEFGQSIVSTMPLLVTFLDNNVTADRKYVLRGRLRLFGKPQTSDILRLILVQPRKVILTIPVTLQNCPPGYFLGEDDACKCSSYDADKSYFGLVRCDIDSFKTYLLRGFWVGYIPPDVQEPQNLYTALCPLTFCRLNTMAMYMNELPSTSNNLSESVCGSNRQGILCGRCLDGFSPFFHSEGFSCGSNDYCSVGFLFYVLSELLPIVILFTIVIIMDFSFTSGTVNGFILFSQLLDTLSIDLRAQNQHAYRSVIFVRFFYGIFNFEYFSTDMLSFCLFKGATVIDLLAFKYITVLFALALVVVLILIMNYVKCSRIEETLNIRERLSVTNGLSAFLVICYLQCTKTSFYIITPVILRTQGGVPGDTMTLFGGLPYFIGRHRFYTVVAVFVIITVVAVPPLVLTLYPLLLQILALCKLSEHWLVCKLLKCLQINRLIPLIDSFQGCYKDKFRFFAGLYFLYRVIILTAYSITRSTSQFYVISQFLLLVFLGVHAVIQPYKKRAHNMIDSCIFLNLVVINACSIFLNVYTVQSRENQFAGNDSVVSLFVTVQITLVYLPMLCFAIWVAVKFISFVAQHCKCTINKQLFRRQLLNDPYIRENSLDDEGLFNTLDFHQMQVCASEEEVTESYKVQEDTDDTFEIKINKASC